MLTKKLYLEEFERCFSTYVQEVSENVYTSSGIILSFDTIKYCVDNEDVDFDILSDWCWLVKNTECVIDLETYVNGKFDNPEFESADYYHIFLLNEIIKQMKTKDY